MLRQLHRALHVDEEDGDLLALALDRGLRLADLLGEGRGMAWRGSRRPPADRQRGAADAAEVLADLDRGAAGGTPRGQFGAAPRAKATVGPVVVVTGPTAHWVNAIGSPSLCPSNSHSTGTSTGAPLSLIKTTTNFAGLVLLAFRPTT